MSGPRKPSSYDAFSTVDSLVSKPVLGSDGAASWQEFQSSKTKHKSRNIAPHIPLKRADKLSGFKSIEDERRMEEKNRIVGGDRKMGSGYTAFKRKGGGHEKGEIAERKRLKLVKERIMPEGQKYFIKAATFGGWKEDYVFTTRDRGTGYYWDGMDSIKKLEGKDSVSADTSESTQITSNQTTKKAKKKKKKKLKKSKDKENSTETSPDQQSDLPSGWAEAIDPTSGKTYYYNVALNQTVWERPENIKEGDDDEKSWEEAKDPSTGKTYYFNRSLNKTTWVRPDCLSS